MSTSDRELLELAARAAGVHGTWTYGADFEVSPPIKTEEYWLADDNGHWLRRWNPLTDDGDALRLAVKLSLLLDIYSGVVVGHDLKAALNITDAWHERDSCDSPGAAASQPHNGDAYAAARRAIVRAAAEIGRSMS